MDEAEEKFKNKPPEVLANLKRNAHQFVCEITGQTMIQIPKYQFARLKAEHLIESRKRKLEGEGKLKKQKAIKNKEDDKENKPPVGEDKPKLLDEKDTTRMDTQKSKMDEELLRLQTFLHECEADGVKEDIPKKALQASAQVKNSLEEQIKVLSNVISEQKVGKKEFVSMMKECKERLEAAKTWSGKLQGYIEDAKSWE